MQMASLTQWHQELQDQYKTQIESSLELRGEDLHIQCNIPQQSRYSLQCGDIIHNIRSTLDHVVSEVLLRVQGEDAPISKYHFPIARDKAAFDRNDSRKYILRHLKMFEPVLSEFKPYAKEGDDRFWVLTSLDNWTKHTLLTPTAMNIYVEGLDLEFDDRWLKNCSFMFSVGVDHKIMSFPGCKEVRRRRVESIRIVPTITRVGHSELLDLFGLLQSFHDLVKNVVARSEWYMTLAGFDRKATSLSP